MTDTIRQVDASDIQAPEIEPEPQVGAIIVPVERLVFDSQTHYQDYKKYLASIVGDEVTVSARVTHMVAELTGFLVTRSKPLDINGARAIILSTNDSYVTFECQGAEGEATIHTTLAAFFHLEPEKEETTPEDVVD